MNDSLIREHTMNSISLNIATETSLKKNVIATVHGNKSHIIANVLVAIVQCCLLPMYSLYTCQTIFLKTRIYACLPQVMMGSQKSKYENLGRPII